MIRRITKHGEDILKKSCPLREFSKIDDLPQLITDMWETMYAANGVGLAAPQIGLSLPLAIIDVKPKERTDQFVLVNPEIIQREGKIIEEEGCLSVPGLYAKVERHKKVTVRATNGDGEEYEITGTGLLARALEHEVDHLHGKLFLNHLSLAERLRVAPILRDLRKGWN